MLNCDWAFLDLPPRMQSFFQVHQPGTHWKIHGSKCTLWFSGATNTKIQGCNTGTNTHTHTRKPQIRSVELSVLDVENSQPSHELYSDGPINDGSPSPLMVIQRILCYSFPTLPFTWAGSPQMHSVQDLTNVFPLHQVRETNLYLLVLHCVIA